jgi:hypothetical protein
MMTRSLKLERQIERQNKNLIVTNPIRSTFFNGRGDRI